jgi:putative colanic acid biosynthesis UDP-glucose lipid carrier transferase
LPEFPLVRVLQPSFARSLIRAQSVPIQEPTSNLATLEDLRLWVPSRTQALDAKRVLDIAVSLAGILILLPLLALVSLAVALDSRGPILFCQRRHGRHGQIFGILKFRSMRVLEDGVQVVQATKNDSRVTRIGRFLRASSIDELPQLFNVLSGEMSLVGPRPHAIAHDEYYGARIPAYAKRQRVKPGITGWAQVNGHRGETDTIEKMQARVEYDLEYLRNWSLGLDLVIILRTVKAAFYDIKAY